MIKKIAGRVLVIPDIHQNLLFAETVLEKHISEVDHIVFLGDYFDCFEKPDNTEYFSMENTCLWLNKKAHVLGDNATWLVGNHDISYIASYSENNKGRFHCYNTFTSSGFSRSKASTFNTKIDKSFILNTELACQVNQFTLSHAGFHPKQFKPQLTLSGNINFFCDDWKEGLNNFSFRNNYYHWITKVGRCRGGDDTVGSPVWLDFDQEFEDMEDLPQVVGHTNGNIFRKTGNSYCIDVYRTTYCILEPEKDTTPIYII